ncbi:helix-turn-helix domain-containing protein [Microbacterium sp.]|uniref:helix-turn-helix domain-containing protein n=1 Tax=Microbacterium sp. TaxID=51671 RepID=UPI003F6ED156
MNTSPKSLALTMKEAAKLVGVDYRTIKQGIQAGTIPTVQLGARVMIPRAELLRVFGIDANRLTA